MTLGLKTFLFLHFSWSDYLKIYILDGSLKIFSAPDYDNFTSRKVLAPMQHDVIILLVLLKGTVHLFG